MRPPKKSKQVSGNQSRQGSGKSHLSKTDLATLAAFCDSVDFDDMPFDTWEDCLSQVNLKVPLFLSAAEAARGGEYDVHFSRSTRAKAGERPTRTPAKCLIQIPEHVTNGQEIRLAGQGDVLAGQAGDLIVIVRLKR